MSHAPIRFWTNRALVVLLLADDPSLRMSDLAIATGLTAKWCGLVVSDLAEAGYLTRTRIGRRNVYKVDGSRTMKFMGDSSVTVDAMLRALHELARREG